MKEKEMNDIKTPTEKKLCNEIKKTLTESAYVYVRHKHIEGEVV